jgi:hypothetical protein
MSYARALAAKYPVNSVRGSNAFSRYDSIKATEKWIEYSLDIAEMSKLLSTLSREERYVLGAALTVAERKRDYMYRHPNFKLNEAAREFKRARRLLKI